MHRSGTPRGGGPSVAIRRTIVVAIAVAVAGASAAAQASPVRGDRVKAAATPIWVAEVNVAHERR